MKENKRSLMILIIVSVLIVGAIVASNFLKEGISLECKTMNSKYCEKDDDCICNTNPCFQGNKNYYEKCVLPKKGIIEACLDACGFGPYEFDFRMICENYQCTFAVFNRTTGGRIS
jgi:hypothetical protein